MGDSVRRDIVHLTVAIGAAIACDNSAQAQEQSYPNRPVHIARRCCAGRQS